MSARRYLQSVADQIRVNPHKYSHDVIAEMIGLGLSVLAGEEYETLRLIETLRDTIARLEHS